ncbi:putative flavoprotein [Pilobolus umbonatus]|nr:putative flavoprotein [Pilobolus umbonatus]
MSQLPTVAVIGTGFSGLCAAIRVKQELGITAVVYEMGDDVGGTWKYNTYPGCACDIPSHLYSLSFELNPDWSEHYSPYHEIHAYLQGVARKYKVYNQTRFNTEVIFAQWIIEKQQWEVHSKSVNNPDQSVSIDYYNYVFAGLGPLRIPNIPAELTGFTGTTVHTALWDHSIDFKGKRVGVIGSGASAIQVIPELRKVAKHVVSFQRTPSFIFPRDQFRFSRIMKFLFRYVPFLMRFFRTCIYWVHESYYPIFGYPNTGLGRAAKKLLVFWMSWQLKKSNRPDLIPTLIPNFLPGCKRVAKSELYLKALAQPNVTVIPSEVKRVEGRFIVDKFGNKEEVDIVVLATGFSVQNFQGNLNLIGKDGLSLKERWENNYPETYMVTTVHGFPNLFILLGAGAGLGHNSVVTMVECQVEYAIKCMKHNMHNNISSMEPKLSAQKSYSQHSKAQFKSTVWKTGCKSWYLNDNGDVSNNHDSLIFLFILITYYK